MQKNIEINITHEFEDEELYSTAVLDIETGWITKEKYNSEKPEKSPHKIDGYQFTSGLMNLGEKELEFAISITSSGQLQVTRDELTQIKEKALALINSDHDKKSKIKP